MQEVKKQLEILLIHYFRECYNDFPKGMIEPGESPDFTIRMKNLHAFGIELTRLNPGNATLPNPEQLQIYASREYFIELVKSVIEHEFPHKLFVKFLFSDEVQFESERQIMIAIQTADLIRKALKEKKSGSFFHVSIHRHRLPKGLNEILIVQHPALENSIWERSNNLGVSNDVVDDIKTAIRKKDEKLKLYQKQRLNYYWLLITTDRLRGVKSFNLPDKIMNHKFHSNFQHVFLFDLMKTEVFQLV